MALDVTRLELGPIKTNAYVVARPDAAEAVVVDPGGDASEILRVLDEQHAQCRGILVTHGHWDHVGGVADLAAATGAPVHMAEGERTLLERVNDFTPAGVEFRPYTPDVLLKGDETLELAGIAFDTLSVPGHSPAHLAYAADGALFSGDVLFAGAVGRYDLPGADWEALLASIRMLTERLPADTVVYPGHGQPTTLGREIDTNPFLGELRASRA